MLSLYVPGESFVHRLPAGMKLLGLFAGSAALFIFSGIAVHASELLLVAALFRIARIPLARHPPISFVPHCCF